MNTFFGALGFYTVKFIFIAAVAIAGIFVGAALRKKKDQKDAQIAASESNSSNQED